MHLRLSLPSVLHAKPDLRVVLPCHPRPREIDALSGFQFEGGFWQEPLSEVYVASCWVSRPQVAHD